MNNLAYLLVLISIVARLCHSGPIPDEDSRLLRRAPQEDEEEAPPRNNSAPSSGLLDIPDDDDDEEDDDEPTTRRPRPRTTTRAPRTTKPTPSGALDFPAPAASKKPGARIVFQPLGQVAFNALTRGFTSAFVPIVKNEQPVGIQYGSIPVDVPWGNDGPSGSDATAAATGVVSGFMKSMWGR
uniref:Uncharacterized protein n=1 Tax=Cacopsylla melanoneura TaxID=428564 RepID=A0A8D8V019_9HEMI